MLSHTPLAQKISFIPYHYNAKINISVLKNRIIQFVNRLYLEDRPQKQLIEFD
jgi:hypothetical protein